MMTWKMNPSVPTPYDLPAFLPYACNQMSAPFGVRVRIVAQEEYVSRVEVSRKIKKSSTNLRKAPSMLQAAMSEDFSSPFGIAPVPSPVDSASDERFTDSDAYFLVQCVMDTPGSHLVEIRVDRCEVVPSLLVRCMQLSVPYQPLLARFSARWCRFEQATLHELAKLLPLCHVTDLKLDDSPAPALACAQLLDTGRLRRLSLARCGLGDEGAAAVAAALALPRPASTVLMALSLAGNAIGDEGARALAAALRTNRTLLQLDLAGNRMRDEGACAILRVLAPFPLTCEEIIASRRMQCDYHRRRAAGRRHEEARGAAEGRDRLRPGQRARAAAELSAAALEASAPPPDPFPPEETLVRDGHVYSRGNAALSWLNVAYNELSGLWLRALTQALREQAAARDAGAAAGLLRVQLDGNPLPPPRAPDYRDIAALLERALHTYLLNKPKKVAKKGAK